MRVVLKSSFAPFLPPSLDPYASSWVSASAGSGKTKLLTDRVLSLLLHDVEPERILCLTFTKAAANEMHQRILSKASQWHLMREDLLQEELDVLYGQASHGFLPKARTLFSFLVEKLQKLRIQTIHSFAQSLLQQFPFEAGISPNFEILDDQNARELIQKAIESCLENIYVSESLGGDASLLALHFDAFSFKEKIGALIASEPQFLDLMSHPLEQTLFFERLLAKFGLLDGETKENLEEEFWRHIPHQNLRQLVKIWQEGTEREKGLSHCLENWLQSSQDLQMYQSFFLTTEGDIRKKPLTNKLLSLWPEGALFMQKEGQRIGDFLQKKSNLTFVALSKIFIKTASEIYRLYRIEKERRGVLDYQDLMLKTASLLKKEDIGSWILYKLDHQIDHILVDEAQDTNKLQWDILHLLTDEFFAHAKTRGCSLFVVGDPKQSIYSFQGVDPRLFRSTESRLTQKANFHQNQMHALRLDTCFRSAPSILSLVDKVFSQDCLAGFLGEDDIRHKPARKEAPGFVHLSPLIFSHETEDLDPWPLPNIEQERLISPKQILVRNLVKTIDNWFKEGKILAGTDRRIEPKDILILVRKRGTLMQDIVHHLKQAQIPVSGCDRLFLLDEIIVQDLLTITEWALHPYDDLSLACVLKSPFFNWSEDDIIALCTERDHDLWQKIRTEHPVAETLQKIIEQAHSLTPFQFYGFLLYDQNYFQKALERLGEETEDIIQAFLSVVSTYEKTHLPVLQSFLGWMKETSFELKRELDDAAQNQIRIMTIHGAKGLQAPIVFLPDTTSEPISKRPEYIKDEKGAPLLFKVEAKSPFLKKLQAKYAEDTEAEHARLLYVALTRAQDQLYILGAHHSEKLHPLSWYQLIKGVFQDVGQENSTGFCMKDPSYAEEKIPQEKKGVQEASPFLPTWIRERVVCEDKQSSFYPQTSPFDTKEKAILGTKLHELLHFLSKIQCKEDYLQKWTNQQGLEIKDLVQPFLPKVLEILENKAFFGPHSYGEVPISGFWKGKRMEGRIDRLVIEKDRILIIDFKTFSHELEQYADQLARYKSWVQAIYPTRKIDTGFVLIDTCAFVSWSV